MQHKYLFTSTLKHLSQFKKNLCVLYAFILLHTSDFSCFLKWYLKDDRSCLP